jgi:hypothetical protein
MKPGVSLREIDDLQKNFSKFNGFRGFPGIKSSGKAHRFNGIFKTFPISCSLSIAAQVEKLLFFCWKTTEIRAKTIEV